MTINSNNFFLLGVRVNNLSRREVLEFIVRGLKSFHKKWYIVTLNPEIIIYANKNKRFKSVLNGATLGLSDGVGVIWAGKIYSKNFKMRVTGVDLVKKFCERAEKEGFVVGFLGGGSKIALKTAECLKSKYPSLKVGFAGEEWSFTRGPVRGFLSTPVKQANSSASGGVRSASARSSLASSNALRAVGSPSTPATPRSTIDILFVAFGFPKQEFWIAENLEKIPVKMAMGVGGAFDFISGNIPRAPKWMQAIGMEWLFRLLIQPWRWKRQLALIEFIFLVLRDRLQFSKKVSIMNSSG